MARTRDSGPLRSALPRTRLTDAPDRGPEQTLLRVQVRKMVEARIDLLPEAYRTVFMLRAVEEMSVEETASHLGLRPETVKTRLHRARRLLRQSLDRTLSSAVSDVFPCAGRRCARITETVLERLGLSEPRDE